MIDVVVDERGQQVVRGADRVEVTGEMEVDVFHRHHLRVTAAGRAALDTEAGAERGLAQADDGLAADAIEGIAEADRGRRLAFSGGRGAYRGDQDQFAVGLFRQAVNVFKRHLGLVMAVGFEVLVRNAEALRGQGHDGALVRCLGNFDV